MDLNLMNMFTGLQYLLKFHNMKFNVLENPKLTDFSRSGQYNIFTKSRIKEAIELKGQAL